MSRSNNPKQFSTQDLIDSLLTDKGPFFLHPEGSPYLGLTLEQQKALAKLRRGNGKTPSWRLQQMRKACKSDYQKLLLHCTHTLIAAWSDPNIRLDYVCVYIKLPYNWRSYYCEDIPRAVILAYDDWTVTVRFKIDSIIEWLYKNGHSHYTASELRKSIWKIMLEQDKLEFYYEVASDTSILELYSDIINDKKSDRSKKGRIKRGENNCNISIDKKSET